MNFVDKLFEDLDFTRMLPLAARFMVVEVSMSNKVSGMVNQAYPVVVFSFLSGSPS